MSIRAHLLPLATSILLAQACVAEGRFAEKSAKIGCDNAKRCWDENLGDFDRKMCEELVKDSAEELLDACTDYEGGLAWKCLQSTKDQSCDAQELTKECKEFNESCGFSFDGQSLIDYEGGISVHTLGDIRWSPHH